VSTNGLTPAELKKTSPYGWSLGSVVPLGEVARVHLGPREPAGERMRLDGQMAVGLGVVAQDGVNAVRFGDAVHAKIAEVAPRLAPLAVRIVAFQPARVAARLSQLGRSLLLGILIVGGVVVLAMGARLGLVVASVVPLVAFAALAIFAIGGGVLHQISIAALVLALGMLVDNAIVVAENVQWRLDRGAGGREAAAAAVRELAAPLAGATGTTVAAFLPMLLADSSTADFTRSIPVVVILTLTISYLFAMLVTPVLSETFLKPGASRATALTSSLAAVLGQLAVRRTRWVLAGAAVLVAVSVTASGWVRQQFFPGADRNQLVVDLKLPVGSHLDATDRAARTLERLLSGRSEVKQVASFIGRGAPRFYYNIQSVPWSPHFAQLMVTTRSTADVEPLLSWLRTVTPTSLPGIEVIGRRLEQGPPVAAPVEVRVFDDNLAGLAQAVSRVSAMLRSVPGATDVRHDLGSGEPTLSFAVDDATAARYGLSRADVAGALAARTRGLAVGELRSGDDPVPIVVRHPAGERLAAEQLDGLDVVSPDGRRIPLGELARVEATWRPAVIHHRNRLRLATVAAQLAPGATFSQVIGAARPRLAALELPTGVHLAFGGDAEGSGEANGAMLRTLPIGILVLLGVLLAEFNSFRRVAIILATVPLAATGVVPGLLLGRQPFGFMSLLGVFALVGIVVNNAIVLLEVVESRRRDGAGVDEALADAVEQRIRPILLTTATTVVGMLPLALSSSTLWPPLAWAMISGLTASTVLTLVVVPALYRVLFGGHVAVAAARRSLAQVATAIVVGLFLVARPASAVEPVRVDLAGAMARASARPAAGAAAERARSSAEAARAERNSFSLPRVGVSASASDRDRALELSTPIGSFPFGASRVDSVGIQIVQPLLDPSGMLHARPAARAEADAARLTSERTRQELAAEAGGALLDVLEIDARRRSTTAFVASLAARLEETEQRVAAGRALAADALKIRLASDQAQQDLLALDNARQVAVRVLGHAVGLEGDAEPVAAPDWTGRPTPAAETTVERALTARPDLEALKSAASALAERRAAVRAEALPRLDARLTWNWTDGSPYTSSTWAEGALVVTWSPLAAGTRAPRAAALAAERNAMDAELVEARRGVEVEVRAALAGIATARSAVGIAKHGVEQATETLRVEVERNAVGRSTTNDLLAAEAAVRDQHTRLEIARLAVVRAWVRLWLATGRGLDSLQEG